MAIKVAGWRAGSLTGVGFPVGGVSLDLSMHSASRLGKGSRLGFAGGSVKAMIVGGGRRRMPVRWAVPAPGQVNASVCGVEETTFEGPLTYTLDGAYNGRQKCDV
tara:strand:- start:25695 stop:26009 length:315 start_codon:yes stop_codon:yes gene_type:complete